MKRLSDNLVKLLEICVKVYDFAMINKKVEKNEPQRFLKRFKTASTSTV